MEHIVCIEDAGERRRIAREVLLALPEWFGIPESTEEYIAESGGQPFWAALGPGGGLHRAEGDVGAHLRSGRDGRPQAAAGARPGPLADGRGAPLGGRAGL